MKKVIAILVASLGLSGTANAMLYERAHGMIYDSVQNVTWLKDANYAKTSGYDADGRMTWANAVQWADNLVYGGYSDWRLPTVTDYNNDGKQSYGVSAFWYNEGGDYGYNVSGSELATMYRDVLGNKPRYSSSNGQVIQPGWSSTPDASADGVTFTNLQSAAYWSGTQYAPDTTKAWYFHTNYGSQDFSTKTNTYYAWAVRSGDVPVPGVLALFGLGLLGMGVARRRS